MAERIGFIGLGVMGKPMARNLMAAGFELVAFSRTRADVDELAGDGAAAAGSPREVAEQAATTILMLPTRRRSSTSPRATTACSRVRATARSSST